MSDRRGPRRDGGRRDGNRGNFRSNSGGFNRGPRGGGGGYNSEPREMFDAKCADCGNDTQVPFKPTEGRPVYCKDCFQSHKKPRY